MGYKLSNKNRIDPIEPICKKKIYASLEEAEDMVRYIRENRTVQNISAYKCNSCGFWHLTSKSE